MQAGHRRARSGGVALGVGFAEVHAQARAVVVWRQRTPVRPRNLPVGRLDELDLVLVLVKPSEQAIDSIAGVTVDAAHAPQLEALKRDFLLRLYAGNEEARALFDTLASQLRNLA